MLHEIGSAVTSASSPLQRQGLRGRLFIVPITTGTSNEDANIGDVSTYSSKEVKLPVLSFKETDKLAREFFRIQKVSQAEIDTQLELPAFQVGLADTAGLPGLVGVLCNGGVNRTGSYSSRLQTAFT